MIRVYSAASPADAHLVCGFLEGRGIRAIVQGESLWSARGEVPLTPDTSPSVWVVDDTDAGPAADLIRMALVGTRPERCRMCGFDLRGQTEPRCPECGCAFPDPQAWECTTCGETIEGQFTECWKCAPRDVEA